MAAIYIREQGAILAKRGELIIVRKSGRTILERRVFGIESVSVFGNVQISTQAAVLLMERGVDVCFFTFGGKYVGRLSADRSKNIFLRLSQGGYYRDEHLRTGMARIIVRNKILNQQRLVQACR